MSRVALYCRLSEEDRNKASADDDSASIQNQKSMLLQYALQQRWEVYRIYSDDDYTGSDRSRPEFQRLLADAKAHRFDIILCKTQSRFTRELELVEKYIHGLFPLLGIRFVSIVDNADTDNKGNKKSRQINGLVNEWYLEDMSDNIRSVLTNRREKGFHIGSFALYGYQKDPDQKGHLIIDPEAAGVVRRVFSLFAQGYGKTAIARILNEEGIPNPTEYKRRKGLRYQSPPGKTGTLWKYPAISHMLTNEIYLGNMVQGRYGSISYKTKQNKPRPKDQWIRVEHTHEPIIDRELWDRVQVLISEKTKPFTTGSVGLFAKKVRCMNCGYTMRSGKSRGQHYLQCSNRHVSKDACEGAFISVSRLEEIVIQELNRLSGLYLDEETLAQNLELPNTLPAQKQRLLVQRDQVRSQLDAYQKGLRELYLDKVRGVVSEEDFLALSRDFSREKAQAEHQLEEIDRRLEDMEARMGAEDRRREVVERYTHPEHLTREMVEILIDHILVGRRQPGEADPPVEIDWNF
jgi:site-specific DNA recombinase